MSMICDLYGIVSIVTRKLSQEYEGIVNYHGYIVVGMQSQAAEAVRPRHLFIKRF